MGHGTWSGAPRPPHSQRQIPGWDVGIARGDASNFSISIAVLRPRAPMSGLRPLAPVCAELLCATSRSPPQIRISRRSFRVRFLAPMDELCSLLRWWVVAMRRPYCPCPPPLCPVVRSLRSLYLPSRPPLPGRHRAAVGTAATPYSSSGPPRRSPLADVRPRSVPSWSFMSPAPNQPVQLQPGKCSRVDST